MTEATDNLAGTTLTEPHKKLAAPAPLPQAREQSTTAASAPDSSLYLEAARACLPRWLQIVGPAPWLGQDRNSRLERARTSTCYRQQLTTLAIGLLCEYDDRHRNDAYLHECVRTSLIGWQLSLRCDGRPADRRARQSPLHSAIVALVVQLLTDTARFQTDVLLDDIERHIKWLAKRPSQTPWLEATAISALVDGALLVRDTSLLTDARRRLQVLLSRQDDEGWFPDCGGVDVGRLSLTVDALARIQHHGGLEDLTRPLQKALGFLLHFVHPDGSVGGCYGSRETAFLSPYGVELLAPDFTDAAALALVARRQCRRFATDRLPTWNDDLCALLGSRIALAAAHASAELPASCRYPCDTIGRTEFQSARLSIFSTDAYHAVVAGRKGGSLHVTWRSGKPNLEDPGVIAIFPHKTLTTGRWSSSTRQRVSESTVTSSGVLRRPPQFPGFKTALDQRATMPPCGWIRRTRFEEPQPSASADRKDDHRKRIDPNRLTHDRFRREITFGDDWIRIRDRVLCRLPCRTIVCQSPPPGRANVYVDRIVADQSNREPIFVEGGRNVEITRVYRDGDLVDRSA